MHIEVCMLIATYSPILTKIVFLDAFHSCSSLVFTIFLTIVLPSHKFCWISLTGTAITGDRKKKARNSPLERDCALNHGYQPRSCDPVAVRNRRMVQRSSALLQGSCLTTADRTRNYISRGDRSSIYLRSRSFIWQCELSWPLPFSNI